jgi:hypothetical protein
MLQRQQYRLARLAEPGKPNEYYLIVIVLQRLQTARIAGGDLFDLRRAYPDSVPLDDPSLIATVLQLIRNRQWITIDQLADAINEYEAVLPGDVMPDPRTSEARHQVTLILRESSIA